SKRGTARPTDAWRFFGSFQWLTRGPGSRTGTHHYSNSKDGTHGSKEYDKGQTAQDAYSPYVRRDGSPYAIGRIGSGYAKAASPDPRGDRDHGCARNGVQASRCEKNTCRDSGGCSRCVQDRGREHLDC